MSLGIMVEEGSQKITADAMDVCLDYMTVLYYSYNPISDPADMRDKQFQLAEGLNLKGRIRVAAEGINGCLGGSRASIDRYIESMCNDPIFEEIRGKEVHWKVSGLVCNPQLPPDKQRFIDLSVKVTKEVVSLDLTPQENDSLLASDPAKHLSPKEFHKLIESFESQNKNKARDQDQGLDQGSNDIVFLDVRNFYETRIGRFESDLLPTIDPLTRQFSDFPKFIKGEDGVEEELKKKKAILMYCTGGVRCERASQFLRSRGIDNLYQLEGGIHAYQEAFPDGGYFKGKNFVYDPRLATGYANKMNECIGKCLVCSSLCDDYRHKKRCELCRVLVLVCDTCAVGHDHSSLLCEYCRPLAST